MSEILPESSAEILARIRARTPARIFTDRTRIAYTTSTWLQLRADHAAARDAVREEIDLERDLGRDVVDRWRLFEAATLARTKDEYLLRPDLGRTLAAESRTKIASLRAAGTDIQVVLGDGLSAAAVVAQVPTLLDRLAEAASLAGLEWGDPFFIRHCRVGIMNDVGEVLRPTIVLLLIGERPGLATAESLSAYMAYKPAVCHDDSRRNLISNIHARGVSTEQAARRIIHLALQMIDRKTSGVTIKEIWTPSLQEPGSPALETP